MTEQKQLTHAVTQESMVNVEYLLTVLWRGKLTIAACMLVAVLLAGYKVYVLATPMYRATAVVMLNNREEQVVDFNSVIGGLGGDQVTVNTEVQILRSRSLLGKVVDKLNLLSDPLFNPSLEAASLASRIKVQIKSLIGVRDTVATWSEEEVQRRNRERAISILLTNLSISNVPQSLVFDVTAQHPVPEKAAVIANAIVDLYILDQLEVKFEATEQATSWLSNRVAELQTNLEEAEAKVADFRASTDVVNEVAMQGLEVQIKDTRERIAQLRGQSNDTDLAAQVSTATSRQEVANLLNDIQLNQLLTRIDQPEIQETFDTRVAELLERRTRLDQRAQTQVAGLEASLRNMEAQLEAQSADLITLQQLTREAEASRMLYEYFLGRLKETSAQRGIQQADSRILAQASPPNVPFSPRKGFNLAVAAIIGMLIGSVLLLIRETRHSAFRTADEIEDYTGVNVLGQVPIIQGRKRGDLLTYLAEKPTSAAAEAVRNLRTSILLKNIDHPPQIIMTCSSVPGEGKTTLAMALALNTSAMGRRVLLVEGDVRRHVFSEYFDSMPRQDTGYSNQLEQGEDFKQSIVFVPEIGCDVLLGGRSNANPADIFASDRFGQMIRKLRQDYDQIIIDTPPILVVPDARIIAHHVDTIAFVVNWDRTSRAQVATALHDFANSGRPIDGIVLNRINPRGMKRYGYSEKYGSYAAYGTKYYKN